MQSAMSSGTTWVTFPLGSNDEQSRKFESANGTTQTLNALAKVRFWGQSGQWQALLTDPDL
jgi:hypothetical protein